MINIRTSSWSMCTCGFVRHRLRVRSVVNKEMFQKCFLCAWHCSCTNPRLSIPNGSHNFYFPCCRWGNRTQPHTCDTQVKSLPLYLIIPCCDIPVPWKINTSRLISSLCNHCKCHIEKGRRSKCSFFDCVSECVVTDSGGQMVVVTTCFRESLGDWQGEWFFAPVSLPSLVFLFLMNVSRLDIARRGLGTIAACTVHRVY